MSDFVQSLWLFDSPRETRNVIRLDLHEAGVLYKWAMMWNDDNKTILEIGRYWGGSTVLLALATHGSNKKIISIDITEGCHDPDVDEWLEKYEEKDRIDLRVGNSHEMEPVPLSMLFVDGDHSYNGIKKDIYQHWDSLDGPCLAHDYTCPMAPGVTKFIDEFINDGYAEVIEQIQTLVVLRKLKNIA